jgi:hypothetical protein
MATHEAPRQKLTPTQFGCERRRSKSAIRTACTSATFAVDALPAQRKTRLTEGGSHVVELKRELRRDLLV